MPELPEVETFVRRLAPIVGTRIVEAEILDDRLGLSGESLVGAEIRGVERRAKYIVIGLVDRGDLAVHLRMSGRLRLDRSEDEVAYTRMILRLDSGDAVYFINPRRLGTVALCASGFDKPLGIDPTDAAFTPRALAEIAASSRAPIKQLLLDQRKIAGIGNIYAAEALWRAGIHPTRASNTLEKSAVAKLHHAITSVLSEAIDQLGTTIGSSVSDYRRSADEGGEFQNQLAVYGRENEACERCSTPIARIAQAGRSTYLCPACQN
jgi:formamidopyrimidine-DNA glycosylase